MMLRQVIHEQINDEEHRQKRLWGEQNHAPAFWLAILAEEFGEAARAVVEHGAMDTHRRLTGREADEQLAKLRATLRRELVQVAAVAVSFIDYLDRQEESKP